MSDLCSATETLKILMARSQDFHEWLPKMEATLVAYSCEDTFRRFQSSYYAEHGEHLCYTISDWLALDIKDKQELVGQKVMLIKPRSELVGIGGKLLFNVKRFYSQRGEEFFTLKDALGLSDKPYIPSHSY